MKKIKHTGDGKTKETAIIFDVSDAWDDHEAQREYMLKQKVEFPKCEDKESVFYNQVVLNDNFKTIYEGKYAYDYYKTTKGDLWFGFDRSRLFDDGIIPDNTELYEQAEKNRLEREAKEKYKVVKHTGDGKTKETAIYFLNAEHEQDESEFEALYLSAHNVDYTMVSDLNSEFFGSNEPDVRHEEIFEPYESPTEGILYIRYFTTKGDLWFKFDRSPIEDVDEYLEWLSENGY